MTERPAPVLAEDTGRTVRETPEVSVPLQTGRADAVGESVPSTAPAPTVTPVPPQEPSWPVLVRVLAAVATGAQPGPGERDAVDTLVSRGLLERTGDRVGLTTLGVLVLDEE